VRVWIDLANSPHVPLLAPVVERLRGDGHEVVLTARDHAQTVELARARWPDIRVVGSESPPGRAAKGIEIARRANGLRRFARRERPDVAFSHGSYAQLVAARTAGLPAVTMMDYEHQPANHLSFRLAQRVIVPEVFPDEALRRCGAAPLKVVRYPGFKEELYLHGFRPDPGVLQELGLDPSRVIAVFRPPPEGALYHRTANERFDDVLRDALVAEVQVVLLPRTREQRDRYRDLDPAIRIPERAIDGSSLLALGDLTVGAGGTMNRESAILGTPTYTLFAGKLAAVDGELIRLGRLVDLRQVGSTPQFDKKPVGATSASNAEAIMETLIATLADVRGSRRRSRPAPRPS
jgi:predicted glycosyltransferase